MNVIWDMGGTLIDTYTPVDSLFVRIVNDAGGSISEHDVARFTRVSISSAMETLANQVGVSQSVFEDAYEDLKKSWEDEPAPLMPGAHECLERVRDSGGLNLVVTHRDRVSATTLIRQHGLDIDLMVCAPDGYARKPDPEMFLEILSLTGLEPGEVRSVGDRDIDVVASHAAGIKAALLETPGIPITSEADWHITRLAEIFDVQ